MPLIEYSPNFRAHCQGCRTKIKTGQIRVGSKARSTYRNGDYILRYWHAVCYNNHKDLSKLYGFRKLKVDDQKRLLPEEAAAAAQKQKKRARMEEVGATNQNTSAPMPSLGRGDNYCSIKHVTPSTTTMKSSMPAAAVLYDNTCTSQSLPNQVTPATRATTSATMSTSAVVLRMNNINHTPPSPTTTVETASSSLPSSSQSPTIIVPHNLNISKFTSMDTTQLPRTVSTVTSSTAAPIQNPYLQIKKKSKITTTAPTSSRMSTMEVPHNLKFSKFTPTVVTQLSQTVPAPIHNPYLKKKKKSTTTTCSGPNAIASQPLKPSSNQSKELIIPDTFNFTIVGRLHRSNVSIVPGQKLRLQRDPNNEYDKNAILVLDFNGQQVGFVRRETAIKLAPILDKNPIKAYYATVTGPEMDHEKSVPAQVQLVSLQKRVTTKKITARRRQESKQLVANRLNKKIERNDSFCI